MLMTNAWGREKKNFWFCTPFLALFVLLLLFVKKGRGKKVPIVSSFFPIFSCFFFECR